MAKPLRERLNQKDPSGLQRTEDRRAREMQRDLDALMKRIIEQLPPGASAEDVRRIVDRELASYSTEARAKVIAWVQDTENRAVIRSRQVLKAAGVRGDAVLGPTGEISPELRARIEINVEAEIDSLSADAKKVLTRSLIDGMTAGEGARVLARRISDDMAMPRQRAELIARTETMRAFNDASKEQYARYGIERVEWLATPDERTCSVCGALHGRSWPLGKEPPCPAHPRCRCVILPVTDA